MREILFRGKRKLGGAWVEGYLVVRFGTWKIEIPAKDTDGINEVRHVIPETVGQFTGLYDKNGTRIFEGDIVEFLGSKYEVLFELGAFGIAGVIDWEAIEKQIPISTGCDNELCACLNDNYISLWEIAWNLGSGEDVLDDVEIIGNKHDNPELLEGV